MGRSSADCDSTNTDNHEINMNNVQRCIRKGDTIFYGKPENINMVKSNVKLNNSSTITLPEKTAAKEDRISSGESLYKTFTFEQSANDEETEKCIAFWRSVIEKNLVPIKCSIIENKRMRNIIKSDTQTQQNKEIRSEDIVSKKSEEEKKTLEEEIEKVHEHYRKMCRDILNELKKRKLNEIELIGKSRCEFCESITPNIKELDEKIDKKGIRKEIKELDNWKSPGWKQKIGVVKDANKNISSLISWAELAKKECTKKYEFRNIIDEKNQNGVYSEWRTNKLKVPCQCGVSETCDCNRNPAVESIVSCNDSGPSNPILQKPISTIIHEDIEMPIPSQSIRDKSINSRIDRTSCSISFNKKTLFPDKDIMKSMEELEGKSSQELVSGLTRNQSKSIMKTTMSGKLHQEIEIPIPSQLVRQKSENSHIDDTVCSIKLAKKKRSSKKVPLINVRNSVEEEGFEELFTEFRPKRSIYESILKRAGSETFIEETNTQSVNLEKQASPRPSTIVETTSSVELFRNKLNAQSGCDLKSSTEKFVPVLQLRRSNYQQISCTPEPILKRTDSDIKEEFDMPDVSPLIYSRPSTIPETTSSIELIRKKFNLTQNNNKSIPKKSCSEKINEGIDMPAVRPEVEETARASTIIQTPPSLELYRKKINQKSESDVISPSETLVPVLQFRKDSASFVKSFTLSSVSEPDSKEQNAHSVALRGSIIRKNSTPRKSFSPKIRCTCDMPNCDCSDLAPVKSISEDLVGICIVPPQKTSLKRNSLEIIRERRSQIDSLDKLLSYDKDNEREITSKTISKGFCN